ncbi:MAG: hypothetical protein RJA36_1457 [Pseudomonadota bacterium]|jgi:hypothetical protein
MPTKPAAEAMDAAIERVLRLPIIPTLHWMGRPYASKPAAALLAVTAWTESRCRARDQLERDGNPGNPGPAYSMYQIELPTFRKMLDGGSEDFAPLRPMLATWGLEWLLERNSGMLLTCSEVGATIAARGLYWSDYWSARRALPSFDPAAAEAAAAYYLGTWRPAQSNRARARAEVREAWPVAVELVEQLWGAY